MDNTKTKSNMPGMLGMLGAEIGGQALGMIAGGFQSRRQYKNQKKLMKFHHELQKELNQQGADLQYDMWKKTNYPAQLAMMEKAGLNPGLMYGQGGGGGTTTGSQGGGAAASGSAPQEQTMLDINATNAIMAAKQIEIADAQARKINAEADTEEQIAKAAPWLEGVTRNEYALRSEKAKQDYQAITHKTYVEGEENNKSDYVKNRIGEFQENLKVRELKTIQQKIENNAIEKRVKLDQAKIDEIWNLIRQRWAEIGIKGVDAIISGALKGK